MTASKSGDGGSGRQVYRVMLFVPADAVEAVKGAVAEAGGAAFGCYSDVFWQSVPGIEQFRPLQGASPASGRIGEISRAASVQLIFAIERSAKALDSTLRAVKEVHPWEEPVIYIEEAELR